MAPGGSELAVCQSLLACTDMSAALGVLLHCPEGHVAYVGMQASGQGHALACGSTPVSSTALVGSAESPVVQQNCKRRCEALPHQTAQGTTWIPKHASINSQSS